MLSVIIMLASCDSAESSTAKTADPLANGNSLATNTSEKTTLAATAEAPPVRIPGDKVITRECFASVRDEERASSGYGSGPGTIGTKGRGGGATSAPPPPAPMAAAPSYAPATSTTSTDGANGISTGGAAGGVDQNSAPAKEKTASRVEGNASNNESSKSEPAVKTSPASEQKPAEVPADTTIAANKDEKKATDMSDDRARGDKYTPAQPMVNPDADPRWDWGATTYLSNDDSMSLASAQRMLWALQNRGPVSASQIRPHEFLNYFSFDTRPVAANDTFSVLAAAEQTGSGTLTMSMAVKGAAPPRMPLDLTLVIDRSGSMSAEGRMDYLKRGLKKMASDNLKKGDRIDLVLFDHELCTPIENYVVGRDDPAILDKVINSLAPRGSTDLDLGLKEGYRIANGHVDTQDRNRRVMLISDALLNTGDVNPDTVSQVGKAYDESGIRLTAIGVGREFNDKVLDKLSEKGKGAYVYLGSEAVVDRIFGVGFESMTRTIAHNVRFALDLPDSLAIEKFYGEEASTNPEDVQPIHYYSGTTVSAVPDETEVRVNVRYQIANAQMRSEAIAGDGGAIEVTVGGNVVVGGPQDVFTFGVSGASVAVQRIAQGQTTDLGSAPTVSVRWAGTRNSGGATGGPTLLNLISGQGTFDSPGHRYRYGSMEVSAVTASGGVRLNVVNVVRLHDEYLYGISEVTSSWPAAALQAQAIAARTYALAKIAKSGVRKACDCHVDDGTGPYIDQTFTGYAKQSGAKGGRWVEAVDATAASPSTGLAVLYDGQPISAFYSSSSGGATNSVKEVWGGDLPYLVSVPDPSSLHADNPHRSWTVTASQAQMSKAFQAPAVWKVEVTKRLTSGAVGEVRATMSDGTTRALTGEQFRTALGLKSAYVTSIDGATGVGAPQSNTVGGATSGDSTAAQPQGETASQGALRVTLRIGPTTTPKAGSRLIFRGKVRPKADSKGVRVERQRLIDGVWTTVDRTRTNAKGRFRFRVKQAVPAGSTFQYRIVVVRKGQVMAVSDEVTVEIRKRKSART